MSSPAQAVSLLGLDIVRALILSLSAFSQFNLSASPDLQMGDLWSHALKVGKCSQQIARVETQDQRLIDDALTAGLLHDCGKLVLAANLPKLFREALVLAQTESISSDQAEEKIFGSTNAEVGAYLLGIWGLPDSVVEAVAFHRRPGRSGGERFEPLTAVHAAVALEEDALGVQTAEAAGILDSEYFSRLNLTGRLPDWQDICQSTNEKKEYA